MINKHLSQELLEVLYAVSTGGILQLPHLQGYPRTKKDLEEYLGEKIDLRTKEEELFSLGRLVRNLINKK